MPRLTLFQQVRCDGGIRTGIEQDGFVCWEHFEPGDSRNSDPALLWFVDVRCRGPKVPADPLQAVQWLREQGPAIRQSLKELADRFHVGVDSDRWPVKKEVTAVPTGVRIEIVFSAQDRRTSLSLAKVFNELARHWERWLAHLQPAVVS